MTFNIMVVVVGLICSLIGAVIGVARYKYSAKKDNIETGQDKGVLLTELGYIKAGIDDIKRKQDGQEANHYHLAERVTRVEESSKQAHLRINRLEKKEGD